MNNALDKYLQALATELRDLPPGQREENLREMRAHLEAITARLVEGGLGEEEATEAALAQLAMWGGCCGRRASSAKALRASSRLRCAAW